MEQNKTRVDKFFEAYGKHDIEAIRQVMDDNVCWYFLGNHPMAGIKRGLNEVISFFDAMGEIMGQSKPEVEKLIIGANENHFFECVRTKTNRDDGKNIDHLASVLWTFKEGKIIEGRHFFSDPQAVDQYFSSVALKH